MTLQRENNLLRVGTNRQERSSENKSVMNQRNWIESAAGQHDGITVCTTFTHFKPEITRLHAKKIDIYIRDIGVVYDHSIGKTLILPNNIT